MQKNSRLLYSAVLQVKPFCMRRTILCSKVFENVTNRVVYCKSHCKCSNVHVKSKYLLGSHGNKELIVTDKGLSFHTSRNWRIQKRFYSSQTWGDGFNEGLFNEEDLDDEEEFQVDDVDKAAEELMQDVEYNEHLRQYCSIPDAGHHLYVIQPVQRMRSRLIKSTGQLQLEEAEALVQSVPGWKVIQSEVVNVDKMKSTNIFGKGQFKKLSEAIANSAVSAVFVCVNHLTKEQLQRLQRKWGIPVLDRYSVVIQIFKAHAKTHEAKLQVALAEVPFIRSRMAEMQAGYIDYQTQEAQHVGGSGDTYIQARSRLLMRRERKIRAALKALQKQRAQIRAQREKKQIPTVAVIGYTNSGKTTFIKALTGDRDMVPCNQLFATLDVTAHAGYLPNRMFAVYMDTVGFISNIPTHLINAFSATLEDAISADLIVHVRDISHPDKTGQRKNVLDTVRRMLSQQQMDTMIEVCNKMDKVDNSSTGDEVDGVFYVSAVTGEGLEELQLEIQNRLLANMGFLQKKIRIPMNGPHLSWLYKQATVVDTETDVDDENMIVHVAISSANYAKFVAHFGTPSK